MKHTRARAALLAFLLVATAACSRDDDERHRHRGHDDHDARARRRTTRPRSRTAASATSRRCARTATPPGPPPRASPTTRSTVGTITDKGGPVAGPQRGDVRHRRRLHRVVQRARRHPRAASSCCRRPRRQALRVRGRPSPRRASQDFALVGGGAVFDEDPNGVRVGLRPAATSPATWCPSAAAPPTSRCSRSRTRSTRSRIGRYTRPPSATSRTAIAHYGIMAVRHPVGARSCSDQLVEVAEANGLRRSTTVSTTQRQGETGWANFVAEMKDKDIKILEFVGQPADLMSSLDQAWTPPAGTPT